MDQQDAAPHRVSFTVYYEDTDCLGVVYYANYLKFMERGRTEYITASGTGLAEWNKQGYLFVVHSLTMKFRRSATLGDRIDVVSTLRMDSPYRATFHQRVERAGELITEADVVLACLDAKQQLTEFPAGMRALATS